MATIDDPKNPYTIIAGLTRENERLTAENKQIREANSRLSNLSVELENERLTHELAAKEVKSERQPAIIEAATEMHRRWVAMINFHDGTGNELLKKCTMHMLLLSPT